MAKIYDAKTGDPKEVPNEQVHEYILSDQWAMEPNSLIPVVFPSGKIVEIPSDKSRLAFEIGLRHASHAAWEKAKADKQYSTGFENAALAASLGLGSGASLSLSNAALVGSGALSPYALEALKEHHPIPYYGSEVLGFLGLSMATAGIGPAAAATGTAVRAGVAGRATTAAVRTSGYAKPNLLSIPVKAKTSVGQKIVGAYGQVAGGGAARDLGRRVGENILLKGVSTTGRMRAARVGQLTAEGAVDAALWQVGEQITEATVNHVTGSPQKSAGTILGEVTIGTMFGGVAGGALGGMWHAFGHSKDKMSEGVMKLYAARYGDIKNPSKGHRLLAERLVKQQDGDIDKRIKELGMTPEGTKHRTDIDEEIVDYQTMMLDFDQAHRKLVNDHASLTVAAKEDLFRAQTIVEQFDRAEQQLIEQLKKIDPAEATRRANNLAEKAKLDLQSQIDATLQQMESHRFNIDEGRKLIAEQQGIAKKQFDDSAAEMGANFDDEVGRLVNIDDPNAIVGATQRHLDLTEEIQRATQGSTKIDALANLMVPGSESGNYAHDVIETMHMRLDELRKTIESKRGDRLYDSENEIDKILGQIDAVEERIVKRFEDIYKIETKPKTAAAKKADFSSEYIIDATYPNTVTQAVERRKLQELLSKESRSHAQVTQELDVDLKKALFEELDNLRKDLSAVIFDKASMNQLDFNQRGLLKDVWQEIRDLQSHKSFGKAGERLTALNAAWKEMMESRQHYSATFGSTKAKGGKNVVDAAKAQSLVWKSLKRNETRGHADLENLRGVQNRFFNAVNQFTRHSQGLGLIKQDTVDKLTASRKRLEDLNENADTLGNLKHLLNEVRGTRSLDFNDVMGRARAAGEEGPFNELMMDRAQMRGDYINPELRQRVDKLEKELAEMDAQKRALKGDLVEKGQQRVAAQIYEDLSDAAFASKRAELEAAKTAFEEGKKRATRTKKDLEAETTAASLERETEIAAKAKEATDVPIPKNYIPQMPDAIKGTLGDMRTHGTTSIPGLLAFQAAGWQGAAASSIGTTGALKALIMAANPEEQYIRRLRTYDILQRAVSDRKKIVKQSLEGKLKKVADKNLVNPLQKILAVVAGKGRLDPLLGNEDKSDFEAATSRLDAIQANPSMKAELLDHAVKGFADDMPETAQALQIKISTILDYVQSVVPRGPASALTAINPQPYEPPDSELFKFERHVAMATNWKSALTNGLASYSITPGEVEAFQTCYPEIFEEIVADYYEARKDIKKRIPREISLAWTTIIGTQNDPTMAPQFMTTVAKSFVAGQPAQPNPQSAALKKVPQSHMTPNQMRYT